jgi:hypothetical protein
MSETLKKDKIQEALASHAKNITHNNIEISSAPLTADYELQYSRFFEAGDKVIEDFTLEVDIKDIPHRVTCDFLSGEYGKEKAVYFIVYKNCNLLNLESFKEKEIKLKTQLWDDWKY